MTMPAGRYYVGDLCYVMNDQEWTEICGLLFDGRTDHGVNEGEFTLKDGRRFALYSTAFGDGVYKDQWDRSYSVDAGCIGCIKTDDIRADKYDGVGQLGIFNEFTSEFTTQGKGDLTRSEWDGIIQIGSISIRT